MRDMQCPEFPCFYIWFETQSQVDSWTRGGGEEWMREKKYPEFACFFILNLKHRSRGGVEDEWGKESKISNKNLTVRNYFIKW